MNDLTGRQFGGYCVIRLSARKSKDVTFWDCRCECGAERTVRAGNLTSGNSTSCGCRSRAATRVRNRTHGHTVGGRVSPEYQTWAHMINRCTVPTAHDYPRYGGRGITVFDAWKVSFESFLEDVGKRPTSRHSLDRIDNAGHYEPGNVRWATVATQNRNRRTNIWIEFQGERLVVADWAARLGLNPFVIYHRVRRGITDPRVLFAPPLGRGRKVS